MEVDCVESVDSNSTDNGKFCNMKAFVNAAREFEATHSESTVNLMIRYLGLVASSCDLTMFSPGRTEVCSFFSSLWRVMCHPQGPQWAGVAVLARASLDPNARHALTHTYKFLPVLARLLTETISNDKKIKLLSVMKEISYGIKLNWQESYLSSLMKQLTTWITQPMTEAQHRTIGHMSLTVLVNICYGNLPAIYTLMRTIDTKQFIVHLISLKDGGYGGVEVCRLLLCLSNATRGTGAIRQTDVHSYLCCTLRTFSKAIGDRDATQLLHAYTFIDDLCSDENFRMFVQTYPSFYSAVENNLKDIEDLCRTAAEEGAGEADNSFACLRSTLKFITILLGLELYSLRPLHPQLMCLCMKASRVCLPESLELFAAVLSQYRDEGRLSQEMIMVINDGLAGLLVPPTLEPGKAGLQWLQVIGALCESSETQERVMKEVPTDAFEDTLYSVLHHLSEAGEVGHEQAQLSVCLACKASLSLAPLSREWAATLNRMLAHHQVRKYLCTGLTSGNGARRKQILQLVKHHYFPSDQMNQVFGESQPVLNQNSYMSVSQNNRSLLEEAPWTYANQEEAIDSLIKQLKNALLENKISDIATSSIMELYGYKITCLEQRLYSHTVALEGATNQTASLEQSLAMSQAAISAQQQILYTTQMQSEKHKKTIEELYKQLEDAETTLRGFRAKLAAERLDKEGQKEKLQEEMRSQLTSMENEMKVKQRESEERYRQLQEEYNALQRKLEQQTNKNSELAGVLIRFEERVKQRDKKLEEATSLESSLKRELENKDSTIKQLEKTVIERENRLYQVTTQLEEMKRVQEMVAKLMSKSATSTPAS